MNSLAARLDTALRAAGHAITGVSIGTEQDRSAWRVHPQNLQATAQPIIDAFVAPTPQQIADEAVDRDIDQKALTAVVRALWEQLPVATRPTLVQLRARIVQIYKTL